MNMESAAQVAARWGLSAKTIRRRIKSGEIAATLIGRSLIVDSDSADRALSQCRDRRVHNGRKPECGR